MTKKIPLLFFVLAMTLGLHAQSVDSIVSKPSHRIVRMAVVPVSLIATGLFTIDQGHRFNRFAIRDERNKYLPDFQHDIDDYLQYSPLLAVFTLNALGVYGKNDGKNRIALLVKSELLMTAITYPLKQVTHQLRPDGSNYHSFPSGHTAQAFVAATFLHKEFGHKSIWYSIGGYSAATAVGALRILNNKHWISDVLVGAGIGILSTEFVYFTHRHRWGKKPALTVVPTYGSGPGLYVAYAFR